MQNKISPGNHYSATCRVCSIYSSQLLKFTAVHCTMNYKYRLRHFVLYQSQHRFNDPRLVSSFQQSKSLTNNFVNENQRHGLSTRRLWNCKPAIHYKRKFLKAKIQALCCIVWAESYRNGHAWRIAYVEARPVATSTESLPLLRSRQLHRAQKACIRRYI
jgi:hypothetical protein